MDKDSFIDPSSMINRSVIKEQVTIYKEARVADSFLGKKSVVGDFSRITHSSLDELNRVDRNCLIYHSRVGRYTYFGARNVIMHSRIGQFCSISWNVTIGPANHDYNRLTTHDFLYNDYCEIKPVDFPAAYDRFELKTKVGSDVWIGNNVTILNGIEIGDGAVIGSGAVVTKPIPPYAIAVGNPAKIIKFRFDQEIIDRLLELKWWDWPIEKIKENYSIFSASPSIDKFKLL